MTWLDEVEKKSLIGDSLDTVVSPFLGLFRHLL